MNDIRHSYPAWSLTTGNTSDNAPYGAFCLGIFRLGHNICCLDAYTCEILKIHGCLTDNHCIDIALLQDLAGFVDDM